MKFAVFVGVALAFWFGVVVIAVASDSFAEPSFTAAVERGLIEGEPSYYYEGHAAPLEIGHAIMTATVELDRRLEASMKTLDPPDIGSHWCDDGDSYWDHGPSVGIFIPQMIAYPFGATYWRIVIWGEGYDPVVFDDRDGFPPVAMTHPYSDDLYAISCVYVKG